MYCKSMSSLWDMFQVEGINILDPGLTRSLHLEQHHITDLGHEVVVVSIAMRSSRFSRVLLLFQSRLIVVRLTYQNKRCKRQVLSFGIYTVLYPFQSSLDPSKLHWLNIK
jgi:hypothetical protein